MPDYKHPCRYCDKLIASESRVCPFCGKANPLGLLRCARCKSPVQRDWIKCGNCGLSLVIACPKCGKMTFFEDYCQYCKAPLTVICPNPKCKTEQAPIGDKCIKCGKPLVKK